MNKNCRMNLKKKEFVMSERDSSQDLAPSNFNFFFSNIETLKGRRFPNDDIKEGLDIQKIVGSNASWFKWLTMYYGPI